jgi:hypothetical protein
MSRLLRVGDKVINLDNIEYITRDESSVVRVHFVHRGGVPSVGVVKRRVLRGLWRRLVGVGIIGTGLSGSGLYTVLVRAFLTPLLALPLDLRH